jgi:hypothetical protein
VGSRNVIKIAELLTHRPRSDFPSRKRFIFYFFLWGSVIPFPVGQTGSNTTYYNY